MTSPISRRHFLRDSAAATGGAAVLAGLDRSSAGALAHPAAPWDRPADPSTGRFASLDRGGPDDDFVARWTRAGSSTLWLTPTLVRFDDPVFGVTEIALEDFEHGRGEHDIQRSFGEGTLEELRHEVTLLQLFG